jgi:hypothetical protein
MEKTPLVRDLLTACEQLLADWDAFMRSDATNPIDHITEAMDGVANAVRAAGGKVPPWSPEDTDDGT